ncbi:hypothetical protein BDV96DRAFT_520159 [Lophiotrema nucula]|uniref:Uncharacterized protein n=1 Tax=Lophiotrema nucula TaxID=690887 RepID=A0A6A5Z969_9PLEO|nr:hypothetical protein BDV96DRAFT_520159 [Lophiotrema nucula]
MADGSKSSQLKRKREEEESLRKKAKKSRKSNAGSEEVNGEVTQEEATTPVREVIAHAAGKAVPEVPSVHEPSATPQSSRKGKKQKIPSNTDLETTPNAPIVNGTDEHTGSKSGGNKKRKSAKPSEEVRDEAKHSAPVPQSRKHDKSEVQPDVKAEIANVASHETQQASEKSKKKKKKDKREKKHRSKTSNQWQVGPPIGGWFLPQDPVFSHDEKHIFLANSTSVQIYATDSSLLMNTLPGRSGSIAAFALSATRPNNIYVANSEGIITIWDWTNASKVASWAIEANVRSMKVVPAQADTNQDLVYSYESGKKHIINVHALRTKHDEAPTELQKIFETAAAVVDFQILLEGRIVFVACQTAVFVGKRRNKSKTTLQDLEYTWREFRTTKPVTTFNSFVRPSQSSTKARGSQQAPRDHLDLAIGDSEGVIHLFEDILSSFASIEQGQKKSQKTDVNVEGLKPKRLHWHREAVGSVKWSQDGNYLISGGGETVLVIWQLSTGKQQTLPHLTAAIESIVVSPVGSSYSVSLANNSVVVLSTTELQAKTSVVGTQSRRVDPEQLPRESKPGDSSFNVFAQVPMAVDMKNPNLVMFSVPSSQPRHQRGRWPAPEPYLQTFDVSTQRTISRQALTRNNATDPNVGPDKMKIFEPSVKFLQISRDGHWLATVDEWTPPHSDMGYLDEGIPEFQDEERSFRRETYLKFWKRDDNSSAWTLETRIGAPHFFEAVGASARVLDLMSNPTGTGFATVGEDRYVRIWGPKTRTRDGITVRAANNEEGLINWSLDQATELSSIPILDPALGSEATTSPHNARLAYSADGSVLAVAVSWPTESDSGVLHLIDAATGILRRSITEISVSALCCLGMVDRFLIIIADSINVWDIVTDELVYSTPMETPGINRSERISLVRLAVNSTDGTFAVSCPHFQPNETSKFRTMRQYMKVSSKVVIYDPHQSRPRWSLNIPGILLSLVAANGSRAYVALDSSSSIHILNPKTSALQLVTPPPESEDDLIEARIKSQQIEEDDEENEPRLSEAGAFAAAKHTFEELDNDKPVVRPEQLQQIFDVGPSHALPSVKDMLNAVVDLYARKPRASNVVIQA